MKQVIMAIAAMCSIAACASTKNNKAAKELTGQKWELSAIGTTGFSEEKVPTLYFTDSNKSVGGYSGCNSFGAKYTINQEKLTIGDVIATQMSCLNHMNTEEKVYQGLQKTDNFKIVNGLLQLRQGSMVLLEYRKARTLQN